MVVKKAVPRAELWVLDWVVMRDSLMVWRKAELSVAWMVDYLVAKAMTMVANSGRAKAVVTVGM